jgi:hypothetical protein
MEEVTGSVQWRKPPRRGLYDWDKILDGKTYILRKGEDFDCKVDSFRTNLLTTASKRGFKLQTMLAEGGTAIIVQQIGAAKPKKEKKKSKTKQFIARTTARVDGTVNGTEDPLYKSTIEFARTRGFVNVNSLRSSYAVGNARGQRLRNALIENGIVGEYDPTIKGHPFIGDKTENNISVTVPSSVDSENRVSKEDLAAFSIEGYEFGSNL